MNCDGNPRTTGGDVFIVTITGPATFGSLITDNGNGTYTVDYTPTVAGDYEVNVQYEGTPIKGMPQIVTVTVGA